MRARDATARAGVLATLGVALVASLGPGCQSLGRWATTPGHPFEATEAPPAPDYADAASWAALPGMKSRANAVPPGGGAADAQADAPADVFFVHPTTYFGGGHWNAPVGGMGLLDGGLMRAITGATLAGQASAFNGAGRIYAPRYRQMTLSGFAHPDVREQALALAYGDVRRAFEFYLAEYARDRPLILAGHSQGSRHLLRLIDERFREGPLRERLVAAYVVGARVWEGPYERGTAALPVCADADATGCLVTWRTFAEGADPALDSNPGEPADGPTRCVNPLSWRVDGQPAPAADNLGSIPLPMLRGPGRPRPGLTGARCGDGVLWIEPITGAGFRTAHDRGNWHAYDYAVFYMNVRANAERRVTAWLEAHDRKPR